MSNVKCFPDFWRLLTETAKRDGFRIHPREYYEKMIEVLRNPSQPPSPGLRPPSPARGRGEGEGMYVRFHASHHESKMIAAAIVAYFGDTATYLHGASSYEHRALMGSYALHWEIMCQAKADGYKFYDFWGIKTRYTLYATRYTNWSGMTRFKMGFATV